jgi:hypothetical protein
MRLSRIAIGLLLVAGCYSEVMPREVPASIEVACATGRMALPGPCRSRESLRELARSPYFRVATRRFVEPVLAAPEIAPIGDPHLAFCREHAEHTVTDGRGRAIGEPIDVLAGIGRAYWSTADGTPTPEVTLAHSGHCFDPTHQGLAPDDSEQMLFLVELRGDLFLVWRAPIVDGMVSGEGTITGEDLTLDEIW